MLFSSKDNNEVTYTPRRALIEVPAEESTPRRTSKPASHVIKGFALVVVLLAVVVGDTQANSADKATASVSASEVPVVAIAPTATSTIETAQEAGKTIPKVAETPKPVKPKVQTNENFTATVVVKPKKAPQEPSEAPRKAAEPKGDVASKNRKLEAADDGSASKTTTKAAPKVTGSGKGAKALAYAKRQIGEPYIRNGDGPYGFDCSGLTMKAWAAAGVKGLPHSAHLQKRHGKKISKSNLRPGDLVFFYSPIHHVAIYAGHGNVIHASRPGKPIGYIKMKYMPYAGAVRPG